MQSFAAIFLTVWLTGWTCGGAFAWMQLLGLRGRAGLATAAHIVWAVLTCAWVVAAFGPCDGAGKWLACWLALSLVAAAMAPQRAARRARQLRSLQLRLHHQLVAVGYWMQPGGSSGPPLGEGAGGSEGRQPAELTVQVRLASGEAVLSDWRVFSRDRVAWLREGVERRLGFAGSDARCVRLLLGGRLLQDHDLICDAAVRDGSEVTAVAMDVEKAQEPQLAQQQQVLPTGPRVFMGFWLCGWTAGEFFAAIALQSSVLGGV